MRMLLALICFGLGSVLGEVALKAAPKAVRRPVSAVVAAAPSTASAKNDAPKRTPKKRARDAGSSGGRTYEMQPMSISIKGKAMNQDGQLLPGANIYVVVANSIGAFGQDAILAQTTTDDAGQYVLDDVKLPVRMFPPKPEVVEGSFQVFGMLDGHGFAWHGKRAYRPRPRPAGNLEPDMERAYYEGEAITNDLLFGPTVPLSGQVRDDLGNPVVGAKVRVGVIDDQRRPGSKMWRFELLTPDDGVANPDRAFISIPCMPEARLSATTDAQGRYLIADVPRDASFAAEVSATPVLGSVTATLTTSEREIKGAESAVASGWNPALIAPRTVAVRTIDAVGKQSLGGVVLHAYGRQLRHAGNEARSDADGHAVLQLPPGRYRLVAEPANGSHYVRSEQEIDVAQAPAEQPVEVAVQPGAVVVLEVTADDSKPVQGVGFSCEVDTSRDRRELQSHTVFVDHPTTGGDGLLRAVIEPGRRRFFITTVPDGYETTEDENPWTDFAAGRTTSVRVRLRNKPPADTADTKEDSNEFVARLRDLWRRQNAFQFKGSITYRMTFRPAGDYVVTRDEIRDVVAGFDSNAGTDIATWINQHLPELNVRLAGPYQLVIDGQRHRRTMTTSNTSGERATSIEVFNGAEIVRYGTANMQVSVEDYRVSRVHLDGSSDLRRWPFVTKNTRGLPGYNVVSSADGKAVLELPSDTMTSRMAVDETTGFIYESSHYQEKIGSGHDEWQFAPVELPGGMIWPRLRVVLQYQRGELNLINIHEISSIEPQQELPADAFVVSLPAGTLVLASDFGPPTLDRDSAQTVSPKQGMATGPVTDAVQFAYSLSPKTRSLWPVLRVGQDAPALTPAVWLRADGEKEAPDLKNKVVLVDFWGQGCGPCVAELPRLVDLARRYAETDLRIVGWHDSSGDVEGVARFARTHGLLYDLAIDHEADQPGWFGALFKSFGVRGIPQSALLDRQGRVVFVGSLREAITRLDDALAASRP